MKPNNSRMLKTDFSRKKPPTLKKRIVKIAKKFDGDTQRVRGQLILDLKVLAELAHNQATKIKERGSPAKKHQKWAQLAAYISNTINRIAKEYDDKKILEELEELKKMAINLESEKGT